MLNAVSNNPILKNATFPNRVQLKALKVLKKNHQKTTNNPKDTCQFTVTEFTTPHVKSCTTTRQDGFRRVTINPNCSRDRSYTTPHTTHTSQQVLSWLKHHYRPQKFSPPIMVWLNSVTWRPRSSTRAPGPAPLSHLCLLPQLSLSSFQLQQELWVAQFPTNTEFSAILKSNYWVQLAACYDPLENINKGILSLYCLH